MPLGALKLVPGVNAERTPTLLQAGLSQSQLIRHRDNLPEKLGGWAKFYPLTFSSPIRDLHAWEGINQDTHLSVGAETSLSIITAGTAKDVTPRTLTTNPAVNFSTFNGSNTVTIVDPGITPSIYDTLFLATPVSVGGIVLNGSYGIDTVAGSNTYTITAATNAPTTVSNGGNVSAFTTTSGSASVLVTLAAHGYSVGELFNIFVSTTVGGVTLAGAYVIQTVPTSDTFTINATTLAISSASTLQNGGNARIVYYIGSGPSSAGAGYGVGPYGIGGYGYGAGSTPSGGTPITTTDWTTDNWGEILLACPQGSAIYSWSPDSGFSTAVVVLGAPTVNGGLFIAMPAQILVCWASSTDGVQDPLLIRWSDSGDFTDFVATTTNQAGSYRLSTGSRIVGAIQAPSQALIWTDVDVWSMQYIGFPLTFGFQKIATGCGALSSHAMGILQSGIFWMGLDQFYVFNGGAVSAVPCDIWDVVFQDLDTNNLHKIRAAPNSGFDEIAWYYPSKSGGTGEIDSYVKVNISGGALAWDYGKLGRSAWIDQSVLGEPIGASPTGYVYQHEISPDADGQPMNSSLTTGYFMLSEGWDYAFVDFVIPDFKYGYFNGPQSATLQLTLFANDYPSGGPTRTYGPFTMSASKPSITCRVRGRQIAYQIQSNDLGSFYRLGEVRFRYAPDGRR